MSFVDLLDLTTFSPTDPEPTQPRPVAANDGGEDADVWDVETVDEMPEDLEALILRDELDPVA